MSIRKTYPMQACKIMHGLWGMGQMVFTKSAPGLRKLPELCYRPVVR